MKEPSVLRFSLSTHTALLLQAEVREGAAAPRTLGRGREGGAGRRAGKGAVKQQGQSEISKTATGWRMCCGHFLKNVLKPNLKMLLLQRFLHKTNPDTKTSNKKTAALYFLCQQKMLCFFLNS